MHRTDLVAGAAHRIAVAGNERDVGEHDVERKIASLEQQARRDPAAALGPAGDGGWVEQALAERAGHIVEIGHARHLFEPELVVGGDHQIDRALDAGGGRFGRVEILRQEDHLEEGRDLVVAGLQPPPEFGFHGRIEIIAHQEAVELGRHELRCGGVVEDHVDHVHAVEIAAVPEHLFFGVVVLYRIDRERGALEVPAGEGTGGFADVVLAVVAHAHGEEFHDLAREILVRSALDVHPGIEESEHRRALRHADHQSAEVAQPLGLEQLELLQHLAVVAHLLFGGGEMAVPEQRHFFLQRAWRGQHAVRPPIGNPVGLEDARAQPVEELVDHRLHRPIAGRLYFHAQRLAGGTGEIGRGGPARREVIESGVEHARFVERLESRVGCTFEVDQSPDGFARGELRKRIDLLGRAAEAGTLQQVRGAGAIPVVGADGREVASP